MDWPVKAARPFVSDARRVYTFALRRVNSCFSFAPVLGACPPLTVLLRQMICDQLRRSRPEKILNVFRPIRFRFFLALCRSSGRISLNGREKVVAKNGPFKLERTDETLTALGGLALVAEFNHGLPRFLDLVIGE
jgi:hypothetical protein